MLFIFLFKNAKRIAVLNQFPVLKFALVIVPLNKPVWRPEK